jgi:WD40 repeat protein
MPASVKSLAIIAGGILATVAIGIIVLSLVRGHGELALLGHTGLVRVVAYTPDGKTLLAAGDGGEVQAWDANRFSRTSTTNFARNKKIKGLAFPATGERFVCVGEDREVRLSTVAQGIDQHFAGGANSFDAVAISPSGQVIVAAGADHDLYHHSGPEFRNTKVLKGHTKRVHSLAISPDGKTLLSAGDDGILRVWDATTGAATGKVSLGLHRIYMIAFSPDGKSVAAVVSGLGLRTWATGQWQKPTHFEGAGLAHCVSFSPDNKTLATGHEDGIIRLWDATTAKLIGQFHTHRGAVQSLAFRPDGQHLAAAQGDSVTIWPATSLTR